MRARPRAVGRTHGALELRALTVSAGRGAPANLLLVCLARRRPCVQLHSFGEFRRDYNDVVKLIHFAPFKVRAAASLLASTAAPLCSLRWCSRVLTVSIVPCPCQSFAYKRMQLLRARFDLHKLLNADKALRVDISIRVDTMGSHSQPTCFIGMQQSCFWEP